MSTFSVQASIANPDLPERRLGVELNGPPGCQGLIGAVTLERFALAADPVHQRLVPVPRVLL